MNNKVLVSLKVPELDKTFDIFLPVNKKIGNILILLNKMLNDISDGTYSTSSKFALFNMETQELYKPDVLLLNTTIRNGTKLLLIEQ